MSARLAALALVAFAWAAPARAQADGVFAPKSVVIYIGNTPGGTYDLAGRLIARHLGRFLPGQPQVVAENMPGAGTLRAANFIARAAPKDGSALGLVSETMAIEQALGNPVVQYDAAKLAWIGRIAPSNAIHMQSRGSKVQSIDDAKRYETPVAGTGPGNIAETIPTLLNAVIGTKFRIVKGYPAANEALLALERGEVEGASSNWATLKRQKADWLREGRVKVILQDLPERSAELPDTPALGELGDTPEARQITGLYASAGAIGRAIFAPPETPPAAVNALRTGFDAMVRDPAFVADALNVGIDLQISTGAALQAVAAKTLATPAPLLARTRAIFAP